MSVCPLDYSLCDKTVTIYRQQGNQILRQVTKNCYFLHQVTCSIDVLGRREETIFQLIMPGETQRVFPGDRVLEGIGPEISQEQWPGFIPAKVAGLAEVAYVKPCYWEGAICHVEAGRK